jgi:hypothetical protein
MITTAKLFEIIGRQYVATLELSEREDELLKKHEEELKEVTEGKDFWFKHYLEEKDRAEDLEKKLFEKISELKGECEEEQEAEGADW